MFFMGALTIPINFSKGRPSGALTDPTALSLGGGQRPFLGGGGGTLL